MSRGLCVPIMLGLLAAAACHHAAPSVGPDHARSAAECAAIIQQVRADTDVRTSPRSVSWEIVLPPQPPPPAARGHTAEVWVPVDEMGRVHVAAVRISGMPDSAYAREIVRALSSVRWQRPVRDGCWTPGWGYMTYTFPGTPP